MEISRTSSLVPNPSKSDTHSLPGFLGDSATHQWRNEPEDTIDEVIRSSSDKCMRDNGVINVNMTDNIYAIDGAHSATRESVQDRVYRISPYSREPETQDSNSWFYNYSACTNCHVPQTKTIEKCSCRVENSNERYIRRGTWPLHEGNERPHLSKNVRKSRTGRERSDSKINSIAEDEKIEKVKGFRFRTLTRDQIIILIATSFTNLLSFLSLSVMAPFFPIEADKKNVNSTISGWIFGAFALVKFLTSPLFGRLLPIIGCRFMYIAGLFLSGGCTLLFGILDKVDTSEGITLFVSLCFITRVLLALGCTSLLTAGFVLLFKHFPDSFATVFGIGEVFTGIGMVTGPAIGGLLYGAGGYILPFEVIGCCSLVALPFIWYFVPAPNEDIAKDVDDDMSILKMLVCPRSIVNCLVVIIASSVWAVLDPTLEPHLRVYGFGPELIGVLFLIMAAFYSITSPLWGHVADKLPDNRTLLIPGMLVCAAGLLLVGPSPVLGFKIGFHELWLTILSLIILGLGSSMALIPTYDVYVDILGEIGYPENTRSYGMVSGLWMSMNALGSFVGPSLGGFLFDKIGFEWLTTWIAAACAFTSILICVTWYVEKKCCMKARQQILLVTPLDKNDTTEKTNLPASISRTDELGTFPPGST